MLNEAACEVVAVAAMKVEVVTQRTVVVVAIRLADEAATWLPGVVANLKRHDLQMISIC